MAVTVKIASLKSRSEFERWHGREREGGTPTGTPASAFEQNNFLGYSIHIE